MHVPAGPPGVCASARSIAAAAFLLAASAGAHAQAADTLRADTALVLRPLEVQGVRSVTTAGGTSAVELRLDSLSLRSAPSLEDVLRQVPMLHVRTNSRGEGEIVARGSESRQVAVLVDGIPLTLGWDARADVSVIPASAAQELRFTRGLSSMLHGPNVLGGVVEVSIAGEHANLPRSAQLTTGVDADGGFGTSAAVTLPLQPAGGDVLVRAGAALRDSPGLPLPRGIREPLGSSRGLRTNTDARSADAFAAVRYRSDRGPWLSASGSAVRSERGIAAELDVPSPRFWRYPHVARTVGVLSGGTGFHETGLGRGDLEFSVGYDVGRTEIVAYSDRSYATTTSFENGDDRTLTLRLLADHTLGTRGDLRGAFTWSDILHDEHVPAGALRYRQRLWSAGGETVWLLAERRGPFRALRLSVGGALDGASTPATGDKPAVPSVDSWGARAGLTTLVGTQVQLHASISRRGRFPALREAFSGALDRFAPNPDLGAEHLVATEAGATAALGRSGHVQLVAFHHRLDDAIVRVTLPDRRFMRVNENRLRTTGLELLAGWSAGPVSVSGDVAWQSAQLITPALRHGHLENQPELFGSVRVAAPVAWGVRAAAHAAYTGRQYCLATTGDDITLPAATRVGGDVSREWRVRRTAGALLSRAEARVSVDNASDAAQYDQCGLPREGRLLRLQLRLF